MAATTATSTDGSGVKYYFEDVDHPQYNSGWITLANWEHTGLTPNTQYRYRVKARNNTNLLETGWSETASATTPGLDITPPTPNPMTWATPPYATSSNSILMVATTATDDSGVQYYFQCTSDANYNSSWQDSSTYQRTSLPQGIYTFVVRARDKSPNQNTTGNSTPPVTVDLKPPTPNPVQWAVGGEPKLIDGGGGKWDWYATMTVAECSDESGTVKYYFECTTEDGFNSDGWLSFTPGSPCTYTVPIGQKTQGHRFRVRARDFYGNQTGWSTELPAN